MRRKREWTATGAVCGVLRAFYNHSSSSAQDVARPKAAAGSQVAGLGAICWPSPALHPCSPMCRIQAHDGGPRLWGSL